MSEQQIQQILKRLDQQDQALRTINQRLEDFEPAMDVFNSVKGFDKVAMWILKALAAFGVGIGVVYAFINWLRH